MRSRLLAAVGCMIALAGPATAPAAAQAERPVAKGTGDCAPSMGLNFLCGLNQPEDILQIGTSKWLVASAIAESLAPAGWGQS
jgi:hypothetical protein